MAQKFSSCGRRSQLWSAAFLFSAPFGFTERNLCSPGEGGGGRYGQTSEAKISALLTPIEAGNNLFEPFPRLLTFAIFLTLKIQFDFCNHSLKESVRDSLGSSMVWPHFARHGILPEIQLWKIAEITGSQCISQR